MAEATPVIEGILGPGLSTPKTEAGGHRYGNCGGRGGSPIVDPLSAV